jgi:hypothetical protein
MDLSVVYMSDLAQQVRRYVANSSAVVTNILEGIPLQICVSWLMLAEGCSDWTCPVDMSCDVYSKSVSEQPASSSLRHQAVQCTEPDEHKQ